MVLSCDNMTAGKGDLAIDGPAVSLYERFLWRLFDGDHSLFRRYQPHFGDKAKIAEALGAIGRPVLILIDEILDYVRQLSLAKHADLATKDMAFIRALADTVNDVPHVAMVIVMIASERDSLVQDEVGVRRRQEIEDLLVRNGTTATVTSNTDFAEIIRRRLFEAPAPAEVVRATSDAFVAAMRGAWTQKIFGALPRSPGSGFVDEVKRCYPFHPSLIQLAEQEWAPVAGSKRFDLLSSSSRPLPMCKQAAGRASSRRSGGTAQEEMPAHRTAVAKQTDETLFSLLQSGTARRKSRCSACTYLRSG